MCLGQIKSDTDEAKFSKKMGSRRKLTGAIRYLVNARSLQLKCARVLRDSLLAPFLTYGRTMI